MIRLKPDSEVGVPVPHRIDRAEIEEPTLLIGGGGWSMSMLCYWRWISSDGQIVTTESPDAADSVWDLVGEVIENVVWWGASPIGVDLRLLLASGGCLDVLSDAAFDTWIMSLPDITLVGPLPAHHFDLTDLSAR